MKSVGKRIHGSILSSRFAFVEARFGASAKNALVSSLPPKDRDKLRSPVFENNWYDFETLDAVDRYVVSKLGGGDERLLHELGRFSADYNYLRLPAKLHGLPPEELLKNATRFNVIFQDSGIFSYESVTPSSQDEQGLVLVYEYPEDIPESYFASGVGFFERLVELSGHKVTYAGGEQKKESGVCRHRYEIRWQREPLPERPKPEAGKVKMSELEASAATEVTDRSERSKDSTAPSLTSVAQSVKSEFDEKFATASVVSQPRAPKKSVPRWRLLLWIVLIAVSALFLVGQRVYLYATREPEPQLRDKIYGYRCTGALAAELRLDKPLLIVTVPVAADELFVEVEVGAAEYSYKTGKIIAESMALEIPLGWLKTPQGAALSEDAVPQKLQLSARKSGEVKTCSCALLEE
ncbi:MAG: hypothetical protein RMM17_10245 [Acidobacteriota bacterium]|nr:hypothetical protein [Blastocatellia bacterium]MDW8413049.1 hypothetical protein [Acidobacteriota bacterium]